MKPPLPAVALALGLLTALLTGCFGQAPAPVAAPENLEAQEITAEAEDRFEELTQLVPSNYTFPGQALLEPAVLWINGTVDSAATAAMETPGDEGGIQFQTPFLVQDISAQLPPGIAAEVHVTLHWKGNPGQSVDLDIYTNLPGAVSSYDPSEGQEMNWNRPVKRAVVNTVGVQGLPAEVGVQVTNGRIAPGQSVAYTLQLQFDYAMDVLTPYHPWAFTVPEGATGVVLRSVKVTGDEHIQSEFVIISPQDELVAYMFYDDIAIPTESVFVPIRQPGEYIFYAQAMHGGFLSLKADAPVPQRAARTLPLVETVTMDFADPVAPGLVSHFGSPGSPGTSATFSIDGTFPLRVEGVFTEDQQALAGDVQLIIRNDLGTVWDGVRSLRLDLGGGQGSVGWTGDHEPWVYVNNSLLAKGTYTIDATINGYTGQLGHRIVTYQRTAAPEAVPEDGA